MRLALLLAAVAMALAVPASAQANTNANKNELTVSAKITSFSAKRGGLVANGIVTGRLRSGATVTKDTSRIRLRVSQRRAGRRCDVLTLNLQKLFLELLGARVETSAINLEVYARRPAILGRLFCALSRARISFPRAAAKLNRSLKGHPLRVVAARTSVPARAAEHKGSCQVLKLILGPLHLDLLGLNIDLYGKDKQSPVIVTITALPGHGLLGDLLCSLAGGPPITSLAALQDLLRGLGVSISDLDLQNLLNSLGIGDLTKGLSDANLQRILSALAANCLEHLMDGYGRDNEGCTVRERESKLSGIRSVCEKFQPCGRIHHVHTRSVSRSTAVSIPFKKPRISAISLSGISSILLP